MPPPRTVHIGIFDYDASLRARRLSGRHAEAAIAGEFAFPNVLYRWDTGESVYDFTEQFGAEPCTITYGPLSGRFLIGRPANLIYISGRYDPMNGFVSLGGLSPQEVITTRWAESLQVLVLSAGFAADVNDEDLHQPAGPLRGQHGPEWWRKFSRTLLGSSIPAAHAWRVSCPACSRCGRNGARGSPP